MPQDYLHTADHDLLISEGDFVVGESTFQHQDLIMLYEKGELRQYPKTGVGIKSFLSDDQLGDAYSEIQRQFEADGMVVEKLLVGSDGAIEIIALYRE